MTDSVVIELLVLSLLLAVNARLFFVARGQRDAVVLLSPVALAISVLVFFAWGITLINGVIFILALVVLLENGLGIWRFCSKLYVDSFSPLLWLSSVVNILLILALGALVVIFRPVPVPSTVQVAERTLALAGSPHSGLRARDGMFAPVDVLLLQLKPASDTGSWTEPGGSLPDDAGLVKASPGLPLVLWITDRRTTARRVKPVAAELASLGYEVVVADFNQDIAASFAARLKGIFSPQEFLAEADVWARESSFQYGALVESLGGQRALQDRTVFFLGDGYTGNGMEAALFLHDFVAGGHAINGADAAVLDGWPEGFGPVGETAPWLNYLVCGSGLMESRDPARSHSIAVAQQSHRVFESILSAAGESSVEHLLEGESLPQESTTVAGAGGPSPAL